MERWKCDWAWDPRAWVWGPAIMDRSLPGLANWHLAIGPLVITRLRRPRPTLASEAMKLSVDERRKILAEQAEGLVDHYNEVVRDMELPEDVPPGPPSPPCPPLRRWG